MHIDTLSEPEQRVLGCLIEKRFTTPGSVPAVPETRCAWRVTSRPTATRSSTTTRRRYATRRSGWPATGSRALASGHSSRAVKYRHLADETLAVSQEQLAVIWPCCCCAGAQTPGELKARTERMVHWNALADVDGVLEELIGRGYVGAPGAPPRDRKRSAMSTGWESPGRALKPAQPLNPLSPRRPAPHLSPPVTASLPVPDAMTAGAAQGPAGGDQAGELEQLRARIETLESRFNRLARSRRGSAGFLAPRRSERCPACELRSAGPGPRRR